MGLVLAGDRRTDPSHMSTGVHSRKQADADSQRWGGWPSGFKCRQPIECRSDGAPGPCASRSGARCCPCPRFTGVGSAPIDAAEDSVARPSLALGTVENLGSARPACNVPEDDNQ